MPMPLTEEERLVRETANHLAGRFRLTSPTELPAPDTARAAWRALQEAGFTALLGEGTETAYFGQGAVPAVLVAEQLARNLVVAPFLGQAVLAPALLTACHHAGVDSQDLVDGGERTTVAFDRSTGLHGIGEDELLAVDATDASAALHLHLAATTATVKRVPVAGQVAGAVDLTRELIWASQGQAPTVELRPDALHRFLALALAALAADMVGVMQGALDTAVAYAGAREQFGRPIGSFQAVQHILAEQEALVRASRAATYHAAWATEALEPDEALLAARVAKAYTSRHVRDVAEACLQAHGGIGMTWEALPHAFLRRGLLDRQLFGDERDQHVEILALRAKAA